MRRLTLGQLIALVIAGILLAGDFAGSAFTLLVTGGIAAIVIARRVP